MADYEINEPRSLHVRTYRYVGFAITEDGKFAVIMGDLTDDGVPVAKVAAILSPAQAHESFASYRRILKEVKVGRG